MSVQKLRLATILALIALTLLLTVNGFAELIKGGKKPAVVAPPAQQRLSGQLSTVAQAKILVNGNSTPSGATIFTDSQIQTPEAIGAAIILWSLGRVDIAPKTNLVLTFTGETMDVNLIAGCLILTTEAGITGTIKTPQGVTHKIGPEKRAFIDVCTGDAGAASPIIGQGAAMKAGAGVCWAVSPPLAIETHGLGALWMFGTPLTGAVIATTTGGRPEVVSASAP